MEQLDLPQVCRPTVLALAHTIPLAGHLGRDKTARRVLQRFYWPALFRDMADYCKRCADCQRAGNQRVRRVPPVPLPVIGEPFARIAMDIVGPLPRSRAGHKYILVVCDYATRYPETIPMKTIDAERVAEELVKIFSRVGIPREILTDQGSNFTSHLLTEIYRFLHVHPIRTTPYHQWRIARAQPMPGHSMGTSLAPRPRPAFSDLQYGNAEATRESGGFWDAHPPKFWNF